MDISFDLVRLPARGETIVAERSCRAPGGKGLNQAVVAARAGASVAFAASLGRDADGDLVAAALASEPLLKLSLWRTSWPTDLSLIMVAHGGENAIVTAGGCADALEPSFGEAFASSADRGDFLLLQGNLSWAATSGAAVAAAGRGARVILNAAPLRWPEEVLSRPWDVLVVNESEARGLVGMSDLPAALRLRDAGAACAIVTLGAAGCAMAWHGGACVMPGHAVDAVDTTGAGDTFCGVLAARLAEGRAITEAVNAAQAAARLSVMRPGAFTALPSADELSRISSGPA